MVHWAFWWTVIVNRWLPSPSFGFSQGFCFFFCCCCFWKKREKKKQGQTELTDCLCLPSKASTTTSARCTVLFQRPLCLSAYYFLNKGFYSFNRAEVDDKDRGNIFCGKVFHRWGQDTVLVLLLTQHVALYYQSFFFFCMNKVNTNLENREL